MSKLADVYAFSLNSDFPQYQKWFSLAEREKNDPSIRLTSEEVKHLEAWEAIQTLYEHTLPDAVSVLASYKDAFKAEFKKYEQAVKDLEDSNKLFEFYKAVLEKLTKLYLESLSQMLSEIYADVYDTNSKSIQLSMEDFRGKKVIRLNVLNSIDGKVYVENFDNEGGAAHIMLGAIVAIYFILTTGLPRILIFDESLSSLFSTTSYKFLQILNQFVVQLGFVFVVVDHHAERFKDFASKVYVVENGVYKSVDKDAFFNSFGG
jgi:hypothetical protein